VKDELVGKRVRCPVCQAIMPVTQDEVPVTPQKPKPPAVQGDEIRRGRGPAPGRARDEDDEFAEDDRPRRRPRDEEDEDDFEERPAIQAGPPKQTVLRILVLVFGILGGLSAGFVGFVWYNAANAVKKKEEMKLAREVIEGKRAGVKGVNLEEAKEKLGKFDNAVKGNYILMAGLPVGILAGLMAFFRIMPIIAGVLMLGEIVAPAVLFLPSLMFTGPFLIGAVLAFFVKSTPAAKPRRRPSPREEEEEDER
jgi:hypothetical protein